MVYITYYHSNIGKILLASKDNQLIGLWLENQKYYLGNIKEKLVEKNDLDIFYKTKNWLDRYFHGKNPSITELSLNPIGTDFQKEVWKLLCQIPYGEVTTYGNLSKKLASHLNKQSMSSQAVGGAIGHNPISIIIPCHRVIGSDFHLTGYAGGIDRKRYLLQLEGFDIKKLKDDKYEKV